MAQLARAQAAVAAALLASAGLVALACPSADLAAAASVKRVEVAPAAQVPSSAARLGAAPRGETITADVEVAPRDPAGLASLALAVSTPSSPSYGRYRSPAQLLQRFSPTIARLHAVSEELRARGISVGSVSSDRLTVEVRASVAVLARAFDTTFVRYRLASGRVVRTISRAATLPRPVASGIVAVIGLTDVARLEPEGLTKLTKQSEAERRLASAGTPATQSRLSPGEASPCSAAKDERTLYGGYTENEIASAYGMSGLYDEGDLGAGVTVGLYELERDEPSDIAAYEHCYGLDTQVSYVKVDGGAGGMPYGSGEAALDIEEVAGLVPKARIIVYQAPNNATGPLDELQYIVEHPTAQVVSTSWGQCELLLGVGRAARVSAAQAEGTLFEMAAAEGQTWVAASGDNGSIDCGAEYGYELYAVDDPGAQPFVTGVGGTTLHYDGTYKRETVWNNYFGSSGGGLSSIWPMPSYQSSAPLSLHVMSKYSSGSPCDSTTGDCREVPDVSSDANPDTGYPVYWYNSWGVFGGTSAGAPLWAALAALADASPVCGGRRLGFLNPALYAIAGSSAYAGDFHDVKVGNNDVYPDDTSHYPAGVGYDLASGLGTPKATSSSGGLVDSLCLAILTRPHPPSRMNLSP